MVSGTAVQTCHSESYLCERVHDIAVLGLGLSEVVQVESTDSHFHGPSELTHSQEDAAEQGDGEGPHDRAERRQDHGGPSGESPLESFLCLGFKRAEKGKQGERERVQKEDDEWRPRRSRSDF